MTGSCSDGPAGTIAAEQHQQQIPEKEGGGDGDVKQQQQNHCQIEGSTPAEAIITQTPLDRRHFRECFDTDAYLRDFYSRVDDPAMQLVLFHLPNLVARLGPLNSLLDFGCGPTIHVAICFRNTVKHIFLADFLPQNRTELRHWLAGCSSFDWSGVCRIIAAREALPFSELARMEQRTREKVRAILHCDCLARPAVQLPAACAPFSAITSFFTLEYCCLCLDEYAAAVRNMCVHLAPGGLLIMGGILEETWCAFGGRRYNCLFIERVFVLRCLTAAGLRLEQGPLGMEMFFEREGTFLLVAKKISYHVSEEHFDLRDQPRKKDQRDFQL